MKKLEGKQMKSKLFITAILALSLVLSFNACESITDDGYYKMGQDSITSKVDLVGKRKLVIKNTSTTSGVITNIYVYETNPKDKTQAANDVQAYFNYLIEKYGFESIVKLDYFPYEGGVELKLKKVSADEGQFIILDIEYNSTGYILTFSKSNDLRKIEKEGPTDPGYYEMGQDRITSIIGAIGERKGERKIVKKDVFF